jgi:hypothetical protein
MNRMQIHAEKLNIITQTFSIHLGLCPVAFSSTMSVTLSTCL